jgi:effector-binding domain-containing protein
VTLSIFIATQKGAFSVERSTIINAHRASVFSYANDLKNWKEWNSLALEDTQMNISYSNNTIGQGSFCIWSGKQGTGQLKTIKAIDNDSIIQTIEFNGNTADVFLSFKDTLDKTKVTLTAAGKMSFTSKISTIFDGGTASIFGSIFEKSLINLDKRLDFEINTYNVKVNGTVRKLQAFYLYQTITSEFSKVRKNFTVVFSKITDFCQKNNIIQFGKPFVIFHTYDTVKQLTKISIGIPIKDPIFTSEGSEILSDTLHAFNAVKTTLTGDYSHTNKAFAAASTYLNTNKITSDTKFSHIEVYSRGKTESDNPSRWITEIYFPTKPKPIYKPTIVTPKTTEEILPKTDQEKEIPSEF